MIQPYIVGITGGSASGKTYFLRTLMEAFDSREICVLSQDNYYKPLHLQPKDANGMVNFDVPESINFEEYEMDLKALKEGRKVERMEYTYNHPTKKPQVLCFEPAQIIIVEGIFVLYFQHLANLIDLKIFIEANEQLKLKRRIERDTAERGIGIEEVLYQYQNHVTPTFEKYILPTKTQADLIITNNQGFSTDLEQLVSFLKRKIV